MNATLRPIRVRHVIGAWALVYFPWLPGWPLSLWVGSMPFAFVVDANLAAQYALIGISLVILTGWVGQISLGQGAFVGIGAFTTGLLSRHWDVPFPLNLLIVVPVSAAAAGLLGLVALRVRGLYLAVATLIFAWTAEAYLFSAPWFVGEGGAASVPQQVIGHPEGVTKFDLANPRVLYLVMLAAVALAWYTAVNIRDSKTGRAFFALRGSETAAASLGIDVVRYKLLAFAISGGLAGMAGNLMMTDLRAVTPVLFQFTVSLFYLGVAVVGGITSLGGAVAAGVLFAALTEVFFRVEFLEGWLDMVTTGLLLGVLLGYPGGLGAFGPALAMRIRAVRDRFAPRRDETAEASAAVTEADEGERNAELVEPPPPRRGRRGPPIRRRIDLDAISAEVGTDDPPIRIARTTSWRDAPVPPHSLPRHRGDREPILEADHVTVRFGGLVAVNDVSLSVRDREIVGLIGPNGAGKTTTFNAMAGFNQPTTGTVKLFGEDVTHLPVHRRAQMGMGRTFQLIQLFPQLSVFDNLLVAAHMANDTGVFAHMGLTGRAMVAEIESRDRVEQVIDLLSLAEIADRSVAGLPFGILRQVEIARALVTEAPLLMLDEPASGLDNAETAELTRLLRYLRAKVGVSILLIEHDVRMVTSVSDYMYVLDRGNLLAEGRPQEVQRNPDVIAAYLGQADEAPARGPRPRVRSGG